VAVPIAVTGAFAHSRFPLRCRLAPFPASTLPSHPIPRSVVVAPPARIVVPPEAAVVVLSSLNTLAKIALAGIALTLVRVALPAELAAPLTVPVAAPVATTLALARPVGVTIRHPAIPAAALVAPTRAYLDVPQAIRRATPVFRQVVEGDGRTVDDEVIEGGLHKHLRQGAKKAKVGSLMGAVCKARLHDNLRVVDGIEAHVPRAVVLMAHDDAAVVLKQRVDVCFRRVGGHSRQKHMSARLHGAAAAPRGRE
jgi:hypothetical protein